MTTLPLCPSPSCKGMDEPVLSHAQFSAPPGARGSVLGWILGFLGNLGAKILPEVNRQRLFYGLFFIWGLFFPLSNHILFCMGHPDRAWILSPNVMKSKSPPFFKPILIMNNPVQMNCILSVDYGLGISSKNIGYPMSSFARSFMRLQPAIAHLHLEELRIFPFEGVRFGDVQSTHSSPKECSRFASICNSKFSLGDGSYYWVKVLDAKNYLGPFLSLRYFNGSVRSFRRLSSFPRLPTDNELCDEERPDLDPFRPCYEFVSTWHAIGAGIAILIGLLGLGFWIEGNHGYCALVWTAAFVALAGCLILTGHEYYCPNNGYRQNWNYQEAPFHTPKVYSKNS